MNMKRKISLLSFLLIVLTACNTTIKKNSTKDSEETKKATPSTTEITPISHATAVIEFDNTRIFLDPTGGKEAFSGFENANYVLITDVHGDHMNLKTLNALSLENTIIIAPVAVANQLSEIKPKEIIILNNGDKKSFSNFEVEAIPMYNLREEALKFHPKGRGNGYVLTINNERIYFSGDTEDIPEMRNLKNIDKAFICMNLPYTMTVESAADAVLAFEPKEAYPYHYRGTDGLSDVESFKEIIENKNSNIKVVQLNWYPNRQ